MGVWTAVTWHPNFPHNVLADDLPFGGIADCHVVQSTPTPTPIWERDWRFHGLVVPLWNKWTGWAGLIPVSCSTMFHLIWRPPCASSILFHSIWRPLCSCSTRSTNSNLFQPVPFGCTTLIAGNPPPRGGLLLGRFPNQEPGGRGPSSKHLVQILQGMSSSSGFLVREPCNFRGPPWGGGGSCDQPVSHLWGNTLYI